MMSDQDHQPFGGTIVLKVNMTCNDLGGGGGGSSLGAASMGTRAATV